MNKKTVFLANPDESVAEFVIRYPQLRAELERLGVDYCCGGKRIFTEALALAGYSWESLQPKFSEILQTAPPATRDWSKAPVSVLADHILSVHHTFTREQITRIQELLARVAKAHRVQHGALIEKLAELFELLVNDILSHLLKEEEILFPIIKALDKFLTAAGPPPAIHCGSVSHPIRQMEHEHDFAGDILAQMRSLTDNYQLPAGACQTFDALYTALPELEADLHEHIHLENNILFPASIAQEAEL